MNGDQSMLTPYASPVSLYCAKLRILLRRKQAQWREVSPEGDYNSPEFRQLVPTGTMPAIVVADLVLADSEAIAEPARSDRLVGHPSGHWAGRAAYPEERTSNPPARRMPHANQDDR